MKTVFLDVDTQIDFLFPAGALYVPGSERIVPNLAALTQHALAHGHQIVSTTDSHTEDDVEFGVWKPHCVEGTVGQQKVAATLSQRPLVIANKAGHLEPVAAQLAVARQILIEKQTLDCFSNLHTNTLLSLLEPDRFVVYGVATEHCVRCALEGLAELGKPIYVVTDAICSLNSEAGGQVINGFETAGGVLRETADVIAENWRE